MARAATNNEPATLLWFRNDLRLADNAALRAAIEGGRRVLPVFVLDRSGGWAPGGASLWWLHGSLAALAADLEGCGATLVLREGDAAVIIPELAEAVGADAVHCGRAHEPAVRALDERVANALAKAGRQLVHHRTATLHDHQAVRTKTGGSYGIYSPYAKAVRALGAPEPPHPAPGRIKGVTGVRSDRLADWHLRPVRPDWAGGMRDTWTPGEPGAHQRLTRFVHDHLADYAAERDNPANADGTSMLSPHLHWGELSPNQVWHAAAAGGAKAGREKFENEVLWHDFAAQALWNDPALPDRPQRPAMGTIPWRRDAPALRAWQQGRTGIPIVDAGMRQLWHIGWMHNRVRMITASFIIKHALVNWTDGEKWFWDTLVDADLATNAMSWQWVAGSGTDSAPFFRIFNPLSQSRKFDPAGAYIRAWVPELAALPDKHVHAPHEAPAPLLKDIDYPRPVVDLAEGRDRALEAFRQTRARREDA